MECPELPSVWTGLETPRTQKFVLLHWSATSRAGSPWLSLEN